jgi:hypothetical protein
MKTRAFLVCAIALCCMTTWSTDVPACFLTCPAGDNVEIVPGPGVRTPDFNRDGAVVLADFAIFGAMFAAFDPCGDFNCDGAIALVDLAVFAFHWLHAGAGATTCAG